MEEDVLDPYENLSEYFVTHPAARNEPIKQEETQKEEDEALEEEPEDVEKEEEEEPEEFIRPSLRDDAPLAGILHPSLDTIDPRIFFKQFSRNGILRFSRLFAANIKPSSKPEIWWPSKTFRKKLNKKKKEEEEATDEEKPKPKKMKLEIIEPKEALVDDEVAMARNGGVAMVEENERKPGEQAAVAAWRMGPAQFWYDKMNLEPTAQEVNYGFKLKSKEVKVEKDESKGRVDRGCGTKDDLLMPYKMIEWEKQVLLDSEEIKKGVAEILEELTNDRVPSCGWIPTQYTRTYDHFLLAANSGSFESMFDLSGSQYQMPIVTTSAQINTSHSIFPSVPSDLDVHNWEENIIWDADEMPHNPEPIMLLVDFNDDPLIYGMPEDKRGEEDRDRKENQYTKKSKMILGQVQQRQKQEEEEQMESSMAQFTDNDPFNLSNDDYYIPKGTSKTLSSNSLLIQHSTPAQNIHTTFFPTHLGPIKLRHWHRLPLSKKQLRMFPTNRFTPVHSVNKHMNRIKETREKMKAAEGGGDIFFMREVADLSGRDADLVMIEYSEEHPVILSQPGMSGKLKNYYKRKPGGNEVEPTFELGEMAFTHQLPFLGQLHPGQSLQSIENNMYRAPIFRHSGNRTDFLLIRCKSSWYIRKLPSLFVAGQQCPLYEVPSPNSKRATIFVRDFLLAYIYRLFWASDHSRRRLKMDDIKNAFPHYAESSVRKRLKQCSQFTRTGAGNEQSFWELKPEFRLPTKEEILTMVTPEMCCAQYSMLAAEQRLKDAGYGEKYFFTPENEEGSDDEVTIEDEIKCAPWNTTRAFLSSQRDKCLLDQTGIADPTGCGQGFSYVRVSQKPHKEDMPAMPKKLVTGTNADLRKLPLKEAKVICREYGVKEEEINALSRWEIIDVIRTLSTQAAKATKEGETVHGMARFARGNTRFSSADMQEKYRKHCQKIFEIQNQTLSNVEPPSTDDDISDEDSDIEAANTLESMLLQENKGNISMSEKARIEYEIEEKERQALKKLIHGEAVNKTEKKEVTAEEKKNASKFGEDVAMSASKISGITANQKLKIYRTIRNENGTESTRVEVVTRPQLIEAYTRIRLTKDDTFIQVYAQMDDQYKEEKRKQKRRLQDQLRRIKKNEEKQLGRPKSVEKKVVLKPNLQKMRCSACGGNGHMKTNRNCPLYGKEEEAMEPRNEIMSMEGTRLKINKKALMMNMAEISKKKVEPVVESPKEVEEEEAGKKKRRTSVMPEEDYLHGPVKNVHRLRADPKVTMSTLLTEIYNEMKAIPGADHHLVPVNAKKVPDYYTIIKNPMDMQKIKKKISDQVYELRKDFLADVKQMLDNSRLYNGDSNIITVAAQQMLELAGKRMCERDEKFIALEKQINPLLDDNDTVGFAHILGEIVQKCKNIPKSAMFHTKVDAKKWPSYYLRVMRPMDLGTMEANAKQRKYLRVAQFREDIVQIFKNSEQFNGPAETNAYTAKAKEIMELGLELLEEKREQLAELESNINQEEVVVPEEGPSEPMADVVEKEEMLVEDDVEEEMSIHQDDDSLMWEDSGQVINDLALSDSDEDERLDELRRANMEDDNQLETF